jgi:peptide/nickel transport system permease protein
MAAPAESVAAAEPVVARRVRGGGLVRFATAVAKRTVEVVGTLLGLLVVTFVIGRLVPIDPVLAVTGPDIPQETYNRIAREMGVDRPVIEQFLRYAASVLRLDLGVSTLTRSPVVDDLRRVLPATLELASVAILIGVAIGLPLGILSAVFRGSPFDGFARVLMLVGYSTPVFWKGLILLLVFYVALGWTAGPGRLDVVYEGVYQPRTGLALVDAVLERDWDLFRDAFAHLVLPAVSLGYGAAAYIGRMTRSFVLEQLRQEYVTAARAKGVGELRVVLVHVLRNCAVQLVTAIALTYGLLLEGAVLTETVFAWPGLGQYMTKAMFNSDMNAVLGGTLVIGAIFLLLNLLSDLLYRLLDPRAR